MCMLNRTVLIYKYTQLCKILRHINTDMNTTSH